MKKGYLLVDVKKQELVPTASTFIIMFFFFWLMPLMVIFMVIEYCFAHIVIMKEKDYYQMKLDELEIK